MFDTFYRVVHAEFRDILGADWSGEMEAVWTRTIDALTGRKATG